MARRAVGAIDVISVEEAADILELGRSTLYRLIQQGRVPYHIKPTGVRYFTPEDLQQIVANGQRPAVA